MLKPHYLFYFKSSIILGGTNSTAKFKTLSPWMETLKHLGSEFMTLFGHHQYISPINHYDLNVKLFIQPNTITRLCRHTLSLMQASCSLMQVSCTHIQAFMQTHLAFTPILLIFLSITHFIGLIYVCLFFITLHPLHQGIILSTSLSSAIVYILDISCFKHVACWLHTNQLPAPGGQSSQHQLGKLSNTDCNEQTKSGKYAGLNAADPDISLIYLLGTKGTLCTQQGNMCTLPSIVSGVGAAVSCPAGGERYCMPINQCSPPASVRDWVQTMLAPQQPALKNKKNINFEKLLWLIFSISFNPLLDSRNRNSSCLRSNVVHWEKKLQAVKCIHLPPPMLYPKMKHMMKVYPILKCILVSVHHLYGPFYSHIYHSPVHHLKNIALLAVRATLHIFFNHSGFGIFSPCCAQNSPSNFFSTVEVEKCFIAFSMQSCLFLLNHPGSNANNDLTLISHYSRSCTPCPALIFYTNIYVNMLMIPPDSTQVLPYLLNDSIRFFKPFLTESII
ncbi:hypothetical protein VP01_2959g1 [Puccinia sorghi]|uniref:Uncharacterized protein n=1 Tax=Puccinia sorghi TaxID=27349 RepID=A0A0L6V0T4_9BASI|nr:hypothetical protein VP01_2959g1 [Puccinia sorghi]